MKGISMTFATLTFKTKQDALNYFKQYLNTHDTIPKEDEPFIEAFMQHHPRGLKTGEKVIITTETQFGKTTKCFGVETEDGIIDKRSYKTAINGYKKSQEVKHCLRAIIQPQIEEFRSATELPDTCPMCNEPMKDPHIDHIIPFCQLLTDFLREQHITVNDIEIEREVGKEKKLKDVELGKKFYEYHKQHAQLRYLCSKCNIKRGGEKI